MYGIVTGKVSKHFAGNVGFQIQEAYTDKLGEERTKNVSVFLGNGIELPPLGAVVKASGSVSASVYEFTNELGTQVKVATMSINNGKAEIVEAATESTPF